MGRSTQDVQRHCPPPDSLFLRWELLGRSPRPVRHRHLQRRRRLQSLALRLQQRRCRGPDRLRPGRTRTPRSTPTGLTPPTWTTSAERTSQAISLVRLRPSVTTWTTRPPTMPRSPSRTTRSPLLKPLSCKCAVPSHWRGQGDLRAQSGLPSVHEKLV